MMIAMTSSDPMLNIHLPTREWTLWVRCAGAYIRYCRLGIHVSLPCSQWCHTSGLDRRPGGRFPASPGLWVHFRAFFAAFFVLSLALATPAQAAWLDRHEAIMGTNIDVEIWHDDTVKGEAAIDAVMDEMRRIDTLMSHYKPESELSQINQRGAKEAVVVDKELFDLIKLSLHFRRSPTARSTSRTRASATSTTTASTSSRPRTRSRRPCPG